MKAKIEGIPFSAIKRIKLKKTFELSTLLSITKVLVYNRNGKIELRNIIVPTIVKPSDARQLAYSLLRLHGRHKE